MKKRFLALLLVLTMMMSLFAVAAAATDDPTASVDPVQTETDDTLEKADEAQTPEDAPISDGSAEAVASDETDDAGEAAATEEPTGSDEPAADALVQPVTLAEAAALATVPSSLPYAADITINGAGTGECITDASLSSANTYAKLYKVDLAAGDVLRFSYTTGSYNEYSTMNTRVYYKDSAGVFHSVNATDSSSIYDSNGNDVGHRYYYEISTADSYYIVLYTYGQATVDCAVTIAKPAIKTVADRLNAAAAITLPYSETLAFNESLGCTPYDDDLVNQSSFGKAYALTLKEGDSLRLSCVSTGDDIDIILYVYTVDADGTITCETNCDNDAINGEILYYTAPADDTYYFYCASYGWDEDGACEVSFASTAAPVDYSEVLDSAVELSPLPYEGTAALDESGTLADCNDTTCYAAGYKLSMAEDDAIRFTIGNTENFSDCWVAVFTKNADGTYSYCDDFDSDNYLDDGERFTFTADSADTYYFLCMAYSGCEAVYDLSVAAYTAPEDGCIDLVNAPISVPGADDLWNWDADNLILTLKDGFSLRTSASKSSILVPAGTTVSVQGSAYIEPNNYYTCLVCPGDLTITIADGAALSLAGDNAYGIYVYEGTLTITGAGSARFIANTGEDVLEAYGTTLKNLTVTAITNDDFIEDYDDVTLENCVIRVSAMDNPITSAGDVTATGCVLSLKSSYTGIICGNVELTNTGLTIRSQSTGVSAAGAVSAVGGSIDIETTNPAIEASSISIAASTQLSAFCSGSTPVLALWGGEPDLMSLAVDGGVAVNPLPITLGGVYRLYGSNGNIFHEGAVTEENISEDGLIAPLDGGTVTITGIEMLYSVTEGDNGEWKQDAAGGLSFKTDAPSGALTGVYVDGDLLDPADYSGDGSTVTLSKDYLSTLAIGEHELLIQYAQGYTEGAFTVSKGADAASSTSKPTSPKTGDTLNPGLYAVLFLLAAGSLALVPAMTKKARKSK